MRGSLPSSRGRLGAWLALGLMWVVLALGCSSPLRGATLGSGGSAGVSASGGNVGTGGLGPLTISIGVGGRLATGGVPGTGGSPSMGGAASTGGVRSTSTACTAEPCPVTLASGREHIWPGIAVAGGDVYWTEHDGGIPMFSFDGDGRVMKVAIAGGPAVMLASQQNYPSYILADATSVYWTTWNVGNRGELATLGYASVVRAALDGTKTGVVAYVDLLWQPHVYGGIATDGANIYWAYQGRRDNDYADGAILKVSLADGNTTTLAADQRGANQIAVNGSNVYWVNASSAQDAGSESSLMKMPVAGGSVTTLDVRATRHRGIALDASYVYWTSDDGCVMFVPLDGGAARAIAWGQAGPVDIAVDDASIYWANRDDGAIRKLPLAGGVPTTLVAGQPWIQALAVDATSVYWTTLGTPENDYKDGAVMKLTPK